MPPRTGKNITSLLFCSFCEIFCAHHHFWWVATRAVPFPLKSTGAASAAINTHALGQFACGQYDVLLHQRRIIELSRLEDETWRSPSQSSHLFRIKEKGTELDPNKLFFLIHACLITTVTRGWSYSQHTKADSKTSSSAGKASCVPPWSLYINAI